MHVRPAAIDGIDITRSVVMFTRRGQTRLPQLHGPPGINCPEAFYNRGADRLNKGAR
jgi:hypothetical protein